MVVSAFQLFSFSAFQLLERSVVSSPWSLRPPSSDFSMSAFQLFSIWFGDSSHR
jgi:hypothetical protein